MTFSAFDCFEAGDGDRETIALLYSKHAFVIIDCYLYPSFGWVLVKKWRTVGFLGVSFSN